MLLVVVVVVVVVIITTLAKGFGEGIVFGSVCLHRTFMFFSATACRIETKFSSLVRLTAHVECFNENYDVIDHVMWQLYWKNVKNLDLYL